MFYDFEDIQTVYLFFIGAVLLIIQLLLIFKLTRRKSRSESLPNLMMFTDVEKMKKEGLISEEEYRQIRSRAAEKELARTRREERIEQDLTLVEKAKINPDLTREMLTEEEIQRAARVKKELEALRKGAAPPERPEQAQSATEPPEMKPAAPAPPPDAVKETPPSGSPAAPKSRMSELDILLEQGAISQADYMRLKKVIIQQEEG